MVGTKPILIFMRKDLIHLFPEADVMELTSLGNHLDFLDEDQFHLFTTIYRAKRKDPQTILILCIAGFLGFNGLHRMVMDQLGLGIVYFLTGGLCLIGTIIDLINYKTITLKYNEKMMDETLMKIR